MAGSSIKTRDHGFFITFEGGEGSGKTTLQQKVSSALLLKGYDLVNTRAPGGTSLGASIRELLLYKETIQLSKKSELFLFLADRSQHVQEVILPALKEKKIILCDRFNDSTLAYQGAARQENLSFIESLCDFAVDELKPNLTIYLDIDPSVGLRRAKQAIVKQGKSTYDRLENEAFEFHNRVRDSYLFIAKKYPERIVVIDSSLSSEEVFNLALSKILDKLEG